MNFIERSLKYRQVTLSVLAVLFLFGVYSLLNMSRREDPKTTIPVGLVVAFYPGASSEVIEQEVTKPIEEALFKFEEVKKVNTKSTSMNGEVIINVEINANVTETDVFWNKVARQMLVLKQTSLPSGVIGPIVNSDFGDTEVYIFGLSGKNVPPAQLKQYAQRLEENLSTIPEVSKIKRDGEQQEEVLLSFNSHSLAKYGLTPTQIMQVLQSQNDVWASGDFKTSNADLAIYTHGRYTSVDDIENQIVGTSKTGSTIRVKDVATVKRQYADANSKVLVGEDQAVIVSVEMQSGKNVVKFGEKVQEKLNQFKNELPSNINITSISDQPEIVHNNISHFITEFFIAIIAVIIIIVLLLPFRIAVVASMAIPMTISLTLGFMNLAGIELQQVSLASLIVVLGLVVDDAIVVADNYVDLLDRGEKRWDAAWKSASELVVPILVATVTIIFAFLPMIILSGAVGEFIESLPYTVTISLSSSFVVAMLFTPFLCYTFIKRGLRKDEEEECRQHKFSLLVFMQKHYNKCLDWCTKHKAITIGSGIVSIALAGIIFKTGIKQQFFPAAERNQFAIELWMPTGTKLETTEASIKKLSALIANDQRVINYSTFIGTSAPRFYYNFAPILPVSNYAQIVVNTTNNETTKELAAELEDKVEAAVPEGKPKVKLMEQGLPLDAPIEVRITGEDETKLKEIGEQVAQIIREVPGSKNVENNFHEDYISLDINLKSDAQRLGFTTQAIALSLYTGFSGATVTTIREGNNTVNVVARFCEDERSSADNIKNAYLTSPVTGQSVPLSQIADVVPTWHSGRVMHLCGQKCLTVESHTDNTLLASELLDDVMPKIAALDLPEGYSISYGGEYKGQNETFSEMVVALSISIVLIFFVLLFQFHNIKESLLIMTTIPLSLFGAIFGLWVTGNNFGFTAFVGLISLSGVVVRNSIILIDHIHELVNKQGMSLQKATIESGKRRLRPIFLTAMAAAFGVIPMIASGSPMWSPLASVIAFGVVWSMFTALLVIPAIYLLWIARNERSQI